MTLKHSYNSTIAEDPASGVPGGLVGPNEWNADHAVSGTSLQTLFNNAGSLTGMSGTSWDNTNLALTITGATVTTSNPILNLSQTWNASGVTFTALKLNVTKTAASNSSLVFDFQVGGTSVVSCDAFGEINVAANGAIGYNAQAQAPEGGFVFPSTNWVNTNHLAVNTVLSVGSAHDTTFSRYGAGIVGLSQDGGAGATTLQVYNTVDSLTSPTNYERGVFDWTTTANVLTIGSASGGTGSNRQVLIQSYAGLSIDPEAGASPTVGTQAGRFYLGQVSGGYQVLSIGSGLVFAWGSAGTVQGGATFDTGLARTVAGVVEVNTGAAGTLTSTFIHWGGQQRVTADVSNATASLANATGLAVALVAGRTYSFEAQLSFTDAAAGGIQAAMVASGGLTATNIIYDGWIVDSAANGIKGNAQATSLGGVVASATTSGTAGHVSIYGIITVNVAGTINVQFAQNTSNGTATVVKRGSYFIVHDMP